MANQVKIMRGFVYNFILHSIYSYILIQVAVKTNQKLPSRASTIGPKKKKELKKTSSRRRGARLNLN